MKNILLVLTVAIPLSLFMSCSKKSLTIEERLASANPVEVKSALTDMWLTGDSTNVITAVKLLDSEAYYYEAALALNLLNSEVVDRFVLAGMNPGKDDKGRNLYFYLASLKRPETAKYIIPGFNWEGMLPVKKPAAKIINDSKERLITKNPYWAKSTSNPIMPSVPNTYKAWHTANPDLLVHNGMIYFYYRGGDGTDRICLATVPYDGCNGSNFNDYSGNPIVGTSKKGFDDKAALDPATIYFNNKVFIYYSGLGEGDDTVGLAVSKDFYNFKKYGAVIKGRAPEVVVKDGLIYLYYVLYNNNGYSIYLATSKDGYNFTKFGEAPVFTPDSNAQAWDSKSVTVPRIVEKHGVYYMLYAGDSMYVDYPAYFGLAYSFDLINWNRGRQNPVFSRGAKGQWDDGGIWYGDMFEYKNKWYLYYEGWGGGESHEKEYGPGGRSQIGMATGAFELWDLL